MASIEQLRKRLEMRRRALLTQCVELGDDLQWFDQDQQPELEEEAQEENIARLLGQLDDRSRAEIAAIDDAILRIEHGDYGRCEMCDDLIPVERLEVLPSATSCVPCAEASERERGRRNRAA
jgi:DnaK suppressor protein